MRGKPETATERCSFTLGTQPVVNEQVQEPGRNILLRDKEHGTGLDKGCAAELYQSGRFLNKGGTTQIAQFQGNPAGMFTRTGGGNAEKQV